MNLFDNLLADLVPGAGPPINTTSDTNSTNVGGIVLIVLLFIVIFSIVLFVILFTNHKDKQIDAENKAEQANQTNKPEANDNSTANEELQKSNAQSQPSTTPQTHTELAEPKNGRLFLIFLIKLILLVGIAFFALWNYRVFDIKRGLSKTHIDNNSSFIQVIGLIRNIEKVEYYKVPHSCNSDNYKIHISTSTDSYLFDADETDIKYLKMLNVLPTNITAESVTVIPFYVEIVVGLLVIIIPFGKRR